MFSETHFILMSFETDFVMLFALMFFWEFTVIWYVIMVIENLMF